jgi:hypothetical protein
MTRGVASRCSLVAKTSGALRDTWSFDGRFWQQRSSSLNPPAEAGALMHDEARERIVLVTRSG